MSPSGLASRSIRYSLAAYLRLGFGALLGVVVLLTLNGFGQSTRRALLDDAQARAFWREVIVAPATDSSPQIVDELDSSSFVDTVAYLTSAIGNETALVTEVELAVATASFSANRRPVDVLPEIPGEVALSRFLAESLHASEGDSVTVDSDVFVVSGIFPTPANRRAITAVALVSDIPDDMPRTRFADRASLDPYLASPDRLIELRTVTTHFDDDPYRSNARRVSAVLGALSIPILMIVAIGMAASVLVFRRTRRSDIEALVAAGYSPNTARAVFIRAGTVAMFAASVVGITFVWGMFHFARSQISAIVGQSWVSAGFAGRTAGRDLAVVAVSVAVAWRVGPSSLGERTVRPARPMSSALGISCLFAGAALSVWAAADASTLGVVGLIRGMATLLFIAVGIFALVALASRPTGVGLRRLSEVAGPMASPAIMAANLLLISSVVLAGGVFAEYRSLHRTGEVPKSGLALEAVRNVDADLLAAAYFKISGRAAVVFRYPSESLGSGLIRLSNGSSYACWSSAKTVDAPCTQSFTLKTASQQPVGAPPGDTWRISAELDDGSGEVTIVRIDESTLAVLEATRAPAIVDPTLFGRYGLGGVAPTGTSLTPTTETSFVLLQQFSDLTQRKQAEIQRLAPIRHGFGVV